MYVTRGEGVKILRTSYKYRPLAIEPKSGTLRSRKSVRHLKCVQAPRRCFAVAVIHAFEARPILYSDFAATGQHIHIETSMLDVTYIM